MDITCSAGLILTLPFASEVSKGEDFLVRNIGTNSVTIVDSIGNTVTTVSSGVAKYIFVTDNSSEAGTWAVVSYGVGSSSADAASLIGYGIKAVSTSLNQAHPVVTSAAGITIDTSYRSKVLVHTGGVATYTFSAVATLADDFFLLFRNSGTGTVTLDPNSSELIDGASSITIQPGESLTIACSGSALYSIGLGKSVQYNFTQLTKDVSAGGTITLSPTEASNKLLTFTGTPSATVTVIVPPVVAIYYTYNNCSTSNSVIVKTSLGTGVTVAQTSRTIAFCDGTDIVSAQSTTVVSSISATDGSAASPAINFATKTNTGIYKSSSQDLGIAVNGTSVGVFTSNGLTTAASGNLIATNLNAALAELQGSIDTISTTLVVSDKTTAYSVVANDVGSIIRTTSGSGAITLPSCAAIGVGFNFYYYNYGGGSPIAITRVGSDTFATGDNSWSVPIGQTVRVVCVDASASGKWSIVQASGIGSGSLSVSLGAYAQSTGTCTVAIGYNSAGAGTNATAIGTATACSGVKGVALGDSANCAANYGTAIGSNGSGSAAVCATGAGSVAIGGSYSVGGDSFAAVITNNTASYGATGANGIAIGKLAKASGVDSISIGTSTIANQTGAIAIGSSSTAASQYSVAINGASVSTSNSKYSCAIGVGASVASIYGKYAFASYYTPAIGGGTAGQMGTTVLGTITTNATPTALTSDTSTVSAYNQVVLPNDSTYAFTILVVARRTDADNESAGYEFKGVIDRNGSAATTALVGSVTKTVLAEDTAAWDVNVAADTTNGALAITVTGEAAKTIRWSATCWTSEITG
jgi:hypothetical protein